MAGVVRGGATLDAGFDVAKRNGGAGDGGARGIGDVALHRAAELLGDGELNNNDG